MSTTQRQEFLADAFSKAGYTAEPLEGPALKEEYRERDSFKMIIKDVAVISVTSARGYVTLDIHKPEKQKGKESTEKFIEFVNKAIPILEKEAEELEIKSPRFFKKELSREFQYIHRFPFPKRIAELLGITKKTLDFKEEKKQCMKDMLAADEIETNAGFYRNNLSIIEPTINGTALRSIDISRDGDDIYFILNEEYGIRFRDEEILEIANRFLDVARSCAGIRENTLEDYPTLKKGIEERVPPDVMTNIEQMLGSVPVTKPMSEKERRERYASKLKEGEFRAPAGMDPGVAAAVGALERGGRKKTRRSKKHRGKKTRKL